MDRAEFNRRPLDGSLGRRMKVRDLRTGDVMLTPHTAWRGQPGTKLLLRVSREWWVARGSVSLTWLLLDTGKTETYIDRLDAVLRCEVLG